VLHFGVSGFTVGVYEIRRNALLYDPGITRVRTRFERTKIMTLAKCTLSNSNQQTRMFLFVAGLVMALGSIAVDVAGAIYIHQGPVAGDGAQYISLAQSVASNRGYHLEIGDWPDQPNLGRTPLWPLLLSLPLRVLPNADPNFVTRCTGAVLHGISAALLVMLTFQLTGSVRAASFAGAILALYVPESGLVLSGYSEVAYVAAMLAGLVLFFEGGRLIYAGVFLGGVAVLARPNYIALPIVLLLLLALFRWRTPFKGRGFAFAVATSALFCLLPALWVVRNYAVSGHFPILSATEGETLYGGNNSVVETKSNLWGYWVGPDYIPGERSKQELSREKTEAEVNTYYHDKGMRYIREHLSALPLLAVGKIIRGFVPIALSPSPVPLLLKVVVASFRLCLYIAFLISFRFWRPRNKTFDAIVTSMFLTTLLTTVVYYGSFRLTFCLEPFLIPFIAASAKDLPASFTSKALRTLRLSSHRNRCCPYCGDYDVYRERRRGFGNLILLVGLRPYQCGSCKKSHWGVFF
jgi:hypothetical protein